MNTPKPKKTTSGKKTKKSPEQVSLVPERSRGESPVSPLAQAHFLPYQLRWLHDPSPIKLWQKSRRIGATYVQSFEDVYDIITNPKITQVWFSSADDSAAKEYILYCTKWAQLFNVVAEDMGEVFLDEKKDITVYQIRFPKNKRITALSSNPKAFRSKGGKVVLDEFAHHSDAAALWKAAKPAITWGYPLRILSTHHGTTSLFNRFCDQIKKGKLHWSMHTTDIFTAANEGLVSRILNKEASEEEIKEWLKKEEEDSFDRITWLEEYCVLPSDENSSFLSYELIQSCESDTTLNAPLPAPLSFPRRGAGGEVFPVSPASPMSPSSGEFFLGIDIGRKKDLTVIWGLERLGDLKYTRLLKILEKMPFKGQCDILYGIIELLKPRRVCIDSTGLGMQLAEETKTKYGHIIEPVSFTNKVKEELAFTLLSNFQDKRVVIPSDHAIREDLHSVRKITTAANNIRFDVNQSETSGHADRFWALALALHAASNNSGPMIIKSAHRRQSYKLLQGFH
jgi:phage FluMu gp28-like protein